MRFSNSTWLWIPLGIAIVGLLLHKTLTIFQLLPQFPQSLTAISLHGVSLMLHIQLLRRLVWAWLLVFTLNLLTLILTLVLWERMEGFVHAIALQSTVMLILLYLNRRLYLAPLEKPDTSQVKNMY
jgi:hypothetical protein